MTNCFPSIEIRMFCFYRTSIWVNICWWFWRFQSSLTCSFSFALDHVEAITACIQFDASLESHTVQKRCTKRILCFCFEKWRDFDWKLGEQGIWIKNVFRTACIFHSNSIVWCLVSMSRVMLLLCFFNIRSFWEQDENIFFVFSLF